MNATVLSGPRWEVDDNSQDNGQAFLDDRDHAGLPFRSRVPVGHPHRAAALAVSTAVL
jgi:hypothetical protein